MISIPRTDHDNAGEATLLPEGRYLIQITSASLSNDESTLFVRYQVLAGNPAAVGQSNVERFSLVPKAKPKLSIILKRLGLQERGEATDDYAQFDEADLEGQRLVVDIIHHEYEGKTSNQWPWGATWDTAHKDVREFVDSLRKTARPAANGPVRQGGGRVVYPSPTTGVVYPAPVTVPPDDEV